MSTVADAPTLADVPAVFVVETPHLTQIAVRLDRWDEKPQLVHGENYLLVVVKTRLDFDYWCLSPSGGWHYSVGAILAIHSLTLEPHEVYQHTTDARLVGSCFSCGTVNAEVEHRNALAQAISTWCRCVTLGSPSDLHGNHPSWRETRAGRLELDGHQCCVCGSFDELEVHHRRYPGPGCESMNDLATLCRRCHVAAHRALRSGGLTR